MGKSDLIGGELWEAYSKKVADRMDNPKNRGAFSEDDAKNMGGKLVVADYGAESCGDAVTLYWIVEESSDKILASRFRSFGCGTAIASSDMMAELCLGKTVDEAVKITNLDVEMALRDDPETPAVPPQKMHCSVMAYDVIKKAAGIYKGVDMEAFEIENMVCECARVTLGTIKDVIRLNNLKTVEEITNFTKAGAFCKSCIKPGGHEKREHYLVDILAQTRAEMEKEKMMAKIGITTAFADMTVIQKSKAVEAIIDSDIRPMLVMDGGNVEILDIKDESDSIDIYIRYLGACSGCAASSTGTLYAMESILKSKLDDRIRVIPV